MGSRSTEKEKFLSALRAIPGVEQAERVGQWLPPTRVCTENGSQFLSKLEAKSIIARYIKFE